MTTHILRALVAATILVAAAPPARAARVALFFNGTYVDDSMGGEAANVRTTLEARGHTVRTFTGISSDAFATALSGQDVLLVPEVERTELGPALSQAAVNVIRTFVEGGGGFIIHGGVGGYVGVLDVLFGLEVENVFPNGPWDRTADAAGTTFATGATSLPNNDGTSAILQPLPTGMRAIYAAEGAAAVTHLRRSAGQIVFLGWDWFDAAADSGWLDALDAAVRQTANRCGNDVVDPGERCDDGNLESGDCCSATCQLEPVGASCADDGDECTADRCDGAGVCVHGPLCDDGNGCTDDVCTAGACTNSPRTGACDDGNACTGDGVCQGTTCVAPAASCDDGNACTTDACDPAAGCQHAAIPAGGPCDDGNGCGPDTCNAAGACTSPNACRLTTLEQRGNTIRMDWRAEGEDNDRRNFCVGQTFTEAAPGMEIPITKSVKGNVKRRKSRATLKLKLNANGRRLLGASGPDGLSVRTTMSINKVNRPAARIQLLHRLSRK